MAPGERGEQARALLEKAIFIRDHNKGEKYYDYSEFRSKQAVMVNMKAYFGIEMGDRRGSYSESEHAYYSTPLLGDASNPVYLKFFKYRPEDYGNPDKSYSYHRNNIINMFVEKYGDLFY